jgi:type IV pilus assembly protein PilQ
LDIILKSKGLGQLRDGNVIRVDTNANIAKLQDDEAKAKESLIKAEDLSTRIISVNYSKAQSISATLKKSLSPRGDITVDEGTNTLIVKDIPKNLDEVSRLVKILDRQTPQVLIEARIVVANTSFARDLGIQWGAAGANQSGNNRFGLFAGPTGGFGTEIPDPTNQASASIPTPPPSGFAVNLPAAGTAGPIGNLGFTWGKIVGRPLTLDLRISAGETKGTTKLLSSPKVVTLDNKEAVIQQGESIPFETVSQSGTQTQFIDATLNLTVTPHITPDGSVIMKIKATKNAIGTFRSARTGAPSIDKREATTEVLVKDGETTVLGGILESSQGKTIEGVPWLQNIPVLGWLFKRQSRSETNNELLIFITPTIVKS